MFKDLLRKLFDNLTNRKASMTLTAYCMVGLTSWLADRSTAVAGNLPTIMGTILAILTVFLGGHVVDSKWSPPPPQFGTKKDDKPKSEEGS